MVTLENIGEQARKDMENLFDNKVFLELWVKVKQGWADDERALRSLGYGDDSNSSFLPARYKRINAARHPRQGARGVTR